MSTHRTQSGTESPEMITVGVTADGDDVDLPVREILTGRHFATGKSGSGKTNTVAVILEQLLDNGYPALVIDVEGEYYGLKEAYEVLHAGTDQECDVQVGTEHAERLAELALEEQVPIILDVSGFLDERDAHALVKAVTQALFTKAKTRKQPFLLAVEEIHEFIPQQGGLDECGKMLVKVAKRGRKHGLGIAGVSQRPADVKKDFITQCDQLIWHRLTWENDTQVVKRVLGSNYATAVEDLDDGEAFLQADWRPSVDRVQFHRRETYDAGATPTLDGHSRPELKGLSSDLVDELQEISQRRHQRQDELERKEQRIEELESTVEDLREELQLAREVNEQLGNLEFGSIGTELDELSVDSAEVQELITQTGENGNLSGQDLRLVIEQMDEQLARSEQQRGALEEKLKATREERDELEERVETLESELESRTHQTRLEGLARDFQEVVERNSDVLDLDSATAAETPDQSDTDGDHSPPQMPAASAQLNNRKVQQYISDMKGVIRDLDKKQLQMLQWFRIYGPGGTDDAYKYAGGSPTSSARSKKNRQLTQAGFVTTESRGTYRYALREDAESILGEHFDDAVVEAAVEEIETALDQALEEIAE